MNSWSSSWFFRLHFTRMISLLTCATNTARVGNSGKLKKRPHAVSTESHRAPPPHLFVQETATETASSQKTLLLLHFISLWGSLSTHSHKHSFSLWLWAACCALYKVNTAICRAKSGLRWYIASNLKGERAQQATATMRTSKHATMTNRMSFFLFKKTKTKKNNNNNDEHQPLWVRDAYSMQTR